MLQRILKVSPITSLMVILMSCFTSKSIYESETSDKVQVKVNDNFVLCSDKSVWRETDSTTFNEVLKFNLRNFSNQRNFVEFINCDTSQILTAYLATDAKIGSFAGFKLNYISPLKLKSKKVIPCDDSIFASHGLALGFIGKKEQVFSEYQYRFSNKDSIILVSHFAMDKLADTESYPWNLFIYDTAFQKYFCNVGYYTKYCILVDSKVVEFGFEHGPSAGNKVSVMSLRTNGWKEM